MASKTMSTMSPAAGNDTLRLGTDWNSEACIYCKKDDWVPGDVAPRTMLSCSCCRAKHTHVECHQKASGEQDDEFARPTGSWFCSQVQSHLDNLVGKRMDTLNREYTIEICQHNPDDRSARTTVNAVYSILRSAFNRVELDNGEDLMELVCYAKEMEDEEANLDFSNFRVVVLRRGAVVISVATLRVFGTKFAELPFVATKEGYRRAGNCRLMIKAVEEKLTSMKVQFLVVPSVNSVLPMWCGKFGYQTLSMDEYKSIEQDIVMVDLESSTMVKKQLVKIPPAKQPSEALMGVATGERIRARERQAQELLRQQMRDSRAARGRGRGSRSAGASQQRAAPRGRAAAASSAAAARPAASTEASEESSEEPSSDEGDSSSSSSSSDDEPQFSGSWHSSKGPSRQGRRDSAANKRTRSPSPSAAVAALKLPAGGSTHPPRPPAKLASVPVKAAKPSAPAKRQRLSSSPAPTAVPLPTKALPLNRPGNNPQQQQQQLPHGVQQQLEVGHCAVMQQRAPLPLNSLARAVRHSTATASKTAVRSRKERVRMALGAARHLRRDYMLALVLADTVRQVAQQEEAQTAVVARLAAENRALLQQNALLREQLRRVNAGVEVQKADARLALTATPTPVTSSHHVDASDEEPAAFEEEADPCYETDYGYDASPVPDGAELEPLQVATSSFTAAFSAGRSTADVSPSSLPDPAVADLTPVPVDMPVDPSVGDGSPLFKVTTAAGCSHAQAEGSEAAWQSKAQTAPLMFRAAQSSQDSPIGSALPGMDTATTMCGAPISTTGGISSDAIIEAAAASASMSRHYSMVTALGSGADSGVEEKVSATGHILSDGNTPAAAAAAAAAAVAGSTHIMDAAAAAAAAAGMRPDQGSTGATNEMCPAGMEASIAPLGALTSPNMDSSAAAAASNSSKERVGTASVHPCPDSVPEPPSSLCDGLMTCSIELRQLHSSAERVSVKASDTAGSCPETAANAAASEVTTELGAAATTDLVGQAHAAAAIDCKHACVPRSMDKAAAAGGTASPADAAATGMPPLAVRMSGHAAKLGFARLHQGQLQVDLANACAQPSQKPSSAGCMPLENVGTSSWNAGTVDILAAGIITPAYALPAPAVAPASPAAAAAAAVSPTMAAAAAAAASPAAAAAAVSPAAAAFTAAKATAGTVAPAATFTGVVSVGSAGTLTTADVTAAPGSNAAPAGAACCGNVEAAATGNSAPCNTSAAAAAAASAPAAAYVGTMATISEHAAADPPGQAPFESTVCCAGSEPTVGSAKPAASGTSSESFASPTSMAKFHSDCLNALLPKVLQTYLCSSSPESCASMQGSQEGSRAVQQGAAAAACVVLPAAATIEEEAGQVLFVGSLAGAGAAACGDVEHHWLASPPGIGEEQPTSAMVPSALIHIQGKGLDAAGAAAASLGACAPTASPATAASPISAHAVNPDRTGSPNRFDGRTAQEGPSPTKQLLQAVAMKLEALQEAVAEGGSASRQSSSSDARGLKRPREPPLPAVLACFGEAAEELERVSSDAVQAAAEARSGSCSAKRHNSEEAAHTGDDATAAGAVDEGHAGCMSRCSGDAGASSLGRGLLSGLCSGGSSCVQSQDMETALAAVDIFTFPF